MEISHWELELTGLNGEHVGKRVRHETPRESDGGSFAYLGERILSFSIEPVAVAQPGE